MAPIERRAKSLLSLRQIAPPAGEQLQTAGQTRAHGGRRKNLNTRGGQLDGEGQTIQARANLDYGGGVLLVQFKIRASGDGALHEESDRRELRQRGQRRFGM